MGTVACEPCNDPHDPDEYTTRAREESSESDFDGSDGGYSSSEDRMPRTKTKVVRDQSYMKGFREAVANGNDGLVLFYIDENPDLNFLSIDFDNGDCCLHVAVRKEHFNLIWELLELGVSV